VKARILRQPPLDRGRLVGAEVVDDHVYVQVDGNSLFDLAEKRSQIFGSVLLVALADHLASGDVECREQVRRPMPNVVRRSTLGSTEIHWKNWLSPLKRLNLRLFVDAQDDRVVRRAHVQTDDVSHLLDEQRILR